MQVNIIQNYPLNLLTDIPDFKILNKKDNWNPNQIPSFSDSVFFTSGISPNISHEDVFVTNVTIDECTLSNYVNLTASNHILINSMYSRLDMYENSITMANSLGNKGYITMINATIMSTKIRNDGSISPIIKPLYSYANFIENEFTFGPASLFNLPIRSTINLINSNCTTSDKSTIYNEGSTIMINSEVKTFNTTIILIEQKSQLLIQRNLELSDNSSIRSINSTIIVSGNLSFRLSSNITIFRRSEFYILGQVHFEPLSLFSSSVSKIFITGTLQTNGIFDDLLGSIFVNGTFDFNNSGHFENSQITVNGKMNVFGFFDGKDSFINVIGNLIAHNDSTIYCRNCEIVVLNGIFYVSQLGQFIISRTSFVNSKGIYIAMGDTFVQEGSTFVNKASMTLNSNVFLTDNTTLSDKVSINNHGELSMNGANKQSINVPIVNNGTIIISNNEIFMYKYNQTKGSFILNGSSIISHSPIDIFGGNMNGNGTINGGIFNNGSIGSNQVNQFSIHGVYNQGSNGILTMTINSLDSFSQLNISSEANLGGTLIIRINQDLLNQATDNNEDINFNILNFEKQSGSFSNIQFKYFNPTTQQDVPEPATKNECREIKSRSSSRSVYVLISNNCNDDKKLAKGAIAGIVIGCAVAVALVGVIFHFREKIFRFSKKEKVSNKMKSLEN
ncbi:hypothetical protein CYY_008935 [Polysphondylium violaceum]|uniref:Transmembrane protein n=1 Tax=Polysphondylium violaceum TaxID=133409 RepID=A0A8J4PMA7_9MYCE|nr:hypothetical protein CYY_008935 [Polysphondylium violaceum]